MTISVQTQRLALVPTLASVALVEVPARIARLADAGGWATCDVCCWPVHPAAAVPGRRPRHPGCLCGVCGAPLLREQIEPGVLWHPQCQPATRPVLTVIGGAR